MQRQIKFRAYHKKFKKLEEPKNLQELMGIGVVPNDNIIFMQFTGLHDKNGVEIYEGDIVKYKYGSKMISEFFGGDGEFHDTYWYRKVEYNENDLFKIHPFMFSNENHNKFHPYECEVIGNIYEHQSGNHNLLFPLLSTLIVPLVEHSLLKGQDES